MPHGSNPHGIYGSAKVVARKHPIERLFQIGPAIVVSGFTPAARSARMAPAEDADAAVEGHPHCTTHRDDQEQPPRNRLAPVAPLKTRLASRSRPIHSKTIS